MILYIALAVLALCIWILTKQRNGTRIPGPRGLPFIGNYLQLKPETFHHQLEEWAKRYGPIYKCNAMGIEMLVLSKPELLRKAFCSDETGVILSDRPPSFLGKYIFRGLKGMAIDRENNSTFKLRKVFHTGLHIYGDGIEAFERTVHREIERLLATLSAIEGQDFDPRPVIERSLGDLMTVLVCGETMSGQDEDIVWNFVNALKKCLEPTYEVCMYNLPLLRFTPGYFGDIYREASRRIDDFIARYFTPYKVSYKIGSHRGIVDAFIKLQADNTAADGTTWLTDEHLDGFVQTAMVGGLVTILDTLLAAYLLLVRHPECLDKAHKEVMAVVGGERLPKLSDKPSMPYTEALIMECQRVTNIIPVSMPRSCSQDIVFEGYEIKKDTRFLPNLWAINQDPDTWDEPEKFCPERFLDSDGTLLPPEHKTRQAFLLFGAGRRSCAGEVLARSGMFLYVASMIQKFEIFPPVTEPLTPCDPRTFIAGFMLKAPAYKLRAVRRQV